MGLVPEKDLAELVSKPPEPAPLGFGEGVAAVFGAGRLTDQSVSTHVQLADDLRDSFRRMNDYGIGAFELPWPVTDSVATAALGWLDSQKDAIAAARAGIEGPPDPFLRTGEEIRQGVRERVEAARMEASRAGLGAQLVGGLGVAFTDPLNLALLPAGVGAAEAVMARMGIEAAIGAASQAGVELAAAGARERAGVEVSTAESLGNVALTGLGAGGLAGVFHGVGAAARRLGLLDDYRAKVVAGEIVPNRETQAAADALQDHVDTIPPLATPAAEAAHLDAVAAAADVLTAEHPIMEASAIARLQDKATVAAPFAPAREAAEIAETPQQAIRSLVDRSIEAERLNPLPPVVDAPPGTAAADPDFLDVETAAAFDAVTADRPDVGGAYVADDGSLKVGSARALADDLAEQHRTLREIADCLLTPELAEEAVEAVV
jgi:hypothetical protein